MGKLRQLTFAACLVALATPAAAQKVDAREDFIPFHDLKSNSDGLVQQALGVLPDSSLGGTLNRISALNDRKPIRDLITELGGADATSEDLPDSYEKGMEAALLDLQDDLAAADEAFESLAADCDIYGPPVSIPDGEMDCREAKYVLLQAVRTVLVNSEADLYAHQYTLGCTASPSTQPDGETLYFCPFATDADAVSDQLYRLDWYEDVQALFEDRGLPQEPILPGDNTGRAMLEATNHQLDIVVEAIHGEPIIDLSVYIPGVPIIDL